MFRLIPVAALALALASCGGGGGSDSTDPTYPPVTYHVANGLRWSSTTSKTAVSRPGLYFTLDTTPSSYCMQQTCDQGGGNCRMTNFNGEPGWRVPTMAELRALYAVQPNPPGWLIGGVWAAEGGQSLDFSNGRQSFSDADTVRHYVTCVKPA